MISLENLRRIVMLVVVAMLASSLVIMLQMADKKTITAYFTESKGVYVGDDVTVLGVAVGTITEITPERDRVKVTMEIDDSVDVPAEARAAIVSKSLVSVRSIVIGPVYESGPKLDDDGEIPVSRTTVPVEFDEVKDELVRLTEALGPQGADSQGAAGELLTSTASFLEGRGTDIRTTIEDLATASSTLADNQGNLFGTVRNLEVFVTALEGSDQLVREFETSLAEASSTLAANREDISLAIDQFSKLTTETKDFFADNGEILAQTLESLQTTTSLVAEKRQSLADLLQVAPTAVSNLHNILDPRVPAITGELAIANAGDPAYIICGALFALGGDDGDCRGAIGPLVQFFKIAPPPVGINPLSGNNVGPDGAVPAESAEQQVGPVALASGYDVDGLPVPGKRPDPDDADLLGQIARMLEGGS